MLPVTPRVRPALDPDFLPAVLWNRAFRERVAADPGARPFALVLHRPGGGRSVHESRVLASGPVSDRINFRYAERLLKFLLWQKGGSRIEVGGAPEIAAALAACYAPGGERAFDHGFMGEKIYGEPFRIEAVASWKPDDELGAAGSAIGGHFDGCRIGFDLGGSDRKAAAVIDGRVVYSEEIAWNPYFQADPAYHIEGVQDSLRRAAAHLPRVDAIGGSAAGVYVNNEVRVASLFRGVPAEAFAQHIRRMFFTLQQRWGGVPFEVVNDGEVTALAGATALNDCAVLGVSMGTSMAGGYVTPAGGLTTWLNELAFAPVDFRYDAPRDEWSGDAGCGVQYFSQQGVARLAPRVGFSFPADLPAAEQLVRVQEAMAAGDPRARTLYESVGTCFGYAVAHYADHYPLRHLLVLGRVTSGAGGGVILDSAREVLRAEFPALAENIRLSLPDEKDKRHGQAVAAAGLPVLRRAGP